MFISEILTEKCWKGYEKKGMKTMFGKRVPNCVKREDVGGKYSAWDHEEPAEYSLHLEKTFGEPDADAFGTQEPCPPVPSPCL